jgi:hypothetical protein
MLLRYAGVGVPDAQDCSARARAVPAYGRIQRALADVIAFGELADALAWYEVVGTSGGAKVGKSRARRRR